jgi:hypothetical protein
MILGWEYYGGPKVIQRLLHCEILDLLGRETEMQYDV